MKKREQIKKEVASMNDKIQAGVESSLNQIVQQVIAYSNKLEQSKTLLDKTQQLFYDSLTQTYSTTSSELKQIYSRTKDFEVKDILSLTYNKDNKTLNERITEHWNKASEYSDKTAMRTYLIDKYDRLLRNETQIVKNAVMLNKVGKLSQLAIVENSGGDCDGSCAEYAGEWPIDKLIPPPYHPNCCCQIYYDDTDNEDDMEDLELENEDLERQKKKGLSK